MPSLGIAVTATSACAGLCLLVSCTQLLGVEEEYTVGSSVAVGGGGTGTGGTGTGGTGLDCPDGEQDNDLDGVCEAACDADTCSGHGTCDDSSGTATCDCDLRYAGESCDACADGYTGDDCAACAPGYQDADDNGTCLPECTESTCSGHGRCEDDTGVATCTCRPDFGGEDCGTPCPSRTAGASCEFLMVFGLDIPLAVADWNVVSDVPYDVDESANVAAFDRVAYRLILDDAEVWVELDPFTTHADELGMPMDWIFDLPVTNVTVRSFSPTQVTIAAPAEGNVEMWSNCYSAGLNGAYDYDDDITTNNPDCYGCVQVHVGTQPVLSFNRWSQGGGNHELGIGASPTGNPDYTFEQNAGDYTTRRLEVYVREAG